MVDHNSLPKLNDSTSTDHIDKEEVENMMAQANSEQRVIIDLIHLIQQNDTSCISAYFIDGPGGTVKTFVYRCLIYSCILRSIGVISLAWTGIAAMLLPHGRTAHSGMKSPLNLHEHSISSMKINSKEASFIRNAKLIIWDEAPMANMHALMCVNRLLQDIMGNNIPFGGKIIILSGDFRQVLPVVPHGSRASTIQNSIKFSPLWSILKSLKLTTNMRTKSEEKEFAKFSFEIGNGTYPCCESDNDEETIHCLRL